MRFESSIKITTLSLFLLLALVGLGFFGFSQRERRLSGQSNLNAIDTATSGNWKLYDPDPNHIWNRLYRSLYRHEGSGGNDLGYDELEPLLWHETKYLLVDPANRRATAALDEFRLSHAEREINEPLKRAILQRDLWAVFDWTAAVRSDSPAKTKLQIKLVQVMKRLALSPEEIASLPLTYRDAVNSKAFGAAYDANNRQLAFLPPDLFDPKGPWVALSSRDGSPVASAHVDQFSGRSTFRVFMRLPEGRAATLEYLQKLSAFPKHFLPDPKNPSLFLPSPHVPQFPAGTQLALVREMVLIDNRGNLHATNMVEDFQIRVHRAIPNEIPQALNTSRNAALPALDVYEFRLSRAKLFAGESGGLRSVTENETEFAFLSSHGIDFEARVPLKACASCHFRPGIYGVLSRGGNDVPSSAPDQEQNETKWWKARQHNWELLQGFWRSSS